MQATEESNELIKFITKVIQSYEIFRVGADNGGSLYVSGKVVVCGNREGNGLINSQISTVYSSI
jgi:hypothetical protein